MKTDFEKVKEFLESVRDGYDNISIRVKRNEKWVVKYLYECTAKEVFDWIIFWIDSRELIKKNG